MITISVNGEIKSVQKGLNIIKLIEILAYKKEGFAVAVNMIFVPIAKYNETFIQEGDKVDILAPVEGG